MSTLRTDAIVDLAGNGKPDLSNGVQIGGVAVTSTAAELNILDGVTSTAAELNILDGVTSTAAELNILDGVTSTAAELNILDGVTATAAEINLIDGGTARGTTAVADGDGFLTNDGGTMRMTKVETLATYMGTKVGGGARVFVASSGVVSGVASIVFTQFDSSKFDYYVFTMLSVIPATNEATLFCQTSTDGGTNFATDSGNYRHSGNTHSIGMNVIDTAIGSSSGQDGVFGDFSLFEPETSGKQTRGLSNCMAIHSASTHRVASTDVSCASSRASAEDNNAVRFIMSAGNIGSGEIVMFGIANA